MVSSDVQRRLDIKYHEAKYIKTLVLMTSSYTLTMKLSDFRTSTNITQKYLPVGIPNRDREQTGQLLLTSDYSLATSVVANIYLLLQSLLPTSPGIKTLHIESIISI